MHNIIVLGASAGGVEIMASLVKQLPATLQAALFVVIHFPPRATSVLPHLLSRAGNLPAHHATDAEVIQMNHIYIAPPDWHMVLRDDRIYLTRGPRENRHRPAIDPLFRSAALAYGERVVGVLLSGLQDDGTAGLQAIKGCGGMTICQDPAEATYPDMPRNAIEQVGVDFVMTIEKIATKLGELARQPTSANHNNALREQLHQETEIAALNWNTLGNQMPPGTSSMFACPSCGGVLWEVENGHVVHYRCRVGHAFSPNDLLLSQENQVEEALWTALRALEERASLLHRMAKRASEANRLHAAQRLQDEAGEIDERIALLHTVLSSGGLTALQRAMQDESHAVTATALPEASDEDIGD
jgi:two-component system chemotaxis response regulator CheB